jgi:DNA-binding CsgD family transcriptional regulator
MPGVAVDRRERLALTDPGADALLAKALAGVDAGVVMGQVQSLPLAGREDRPAMVVHIVPVRGAARDVFSAANAILIVTPVLPREVPSVEVISGLFDLTPSEARIARAVGAGQTVEAIAAERRVSRETVRHQLKAVLAKAGISRQAELARLLAGIAVPGAAPR